MVSKRAVLAVLVAVMGALGFVTPQAVSAATGVTHDVAAKNTAFVPSSVTVASGDSVQWTNNDLAIHTVTADDGSFDSGDLGKGATFTLPFSASGVVHYYCMHHGGPGGVGMSGTVTVQGGGGGGPTIAISDATVTEPNTGATKTAVFTVTRTGSTAAASSVRYATVNGTATAGSDYTAVTRTLRFRAGVASKKIKVTVLGDNLRESNETFSVSLSAPTGGTISDATGVGTIVDND